MCECYYFGRIVRSSHVPVATTDQSSPPSWKTISSSHSNQMTSLWANNMKLRAPLVVLFSVCRRDSSTSLFSRRDFLSHPLSSRIHVSIFLFVISMIPLARSIPTSVWRRAVCACIWHALLLNGIKLTMVYNVLKPPSPCRCMAESSYN